MCGDALGDLSAAETNKVFFFPILVRKEKESWEEFIAVASQKLKDGSLAGEYQEKKKNEFLKNLGE